MGRAVKKGKESWGTWEIFEVEEIILLKIIEKFNLLKVSSNSFVLCCAGGLILHAN